ncbi:hypothetical protein HELRODRAFT_162666 [Helobdella robusta]|uniref:Ig-like domain-containing protein n=1 Tax=Helobdella robusta TaxID=6412 RepID=T1ESZ6_HELRO|nr:hypothetical protein HELRODRAFT_162666 [Helobdella robusta]ESN99171.1 hypothetical protein HELRODRAFT_162666 [Helobdella robusta]
MSAETYPKCELSLNDTTTYDPSNPVALSKPTRQENGDVMMEVTENQWTQVRCSCDGEAAGSSSLRWTKDGVVAADGNELNLKNVQRSSAGTYKCTCNRILSPTYAASFQASDTKKLVLSVLYKPGQGRIDIPKYIISEERTTFSCFTEQPGNPPCDYIWYKEEQEIFRGKDYELNPVMLSHAGSYSCLPINKVGLGSRDSKQVVVIEYPKPLMGSDDQDLVESSLMPASAVQLKCQFTGSPPPTITWYKDGIPISSLADNDKRFEVSQKNEVQSESHRYIATSLLKFYGPKRTSLKALEREESGSYSCVASFDFVKYEVQSHVSLFIKFPPEITNDKKQSVEMHKTGRIYFKIKSYPKPFAIKWFNSSKEMIQNSFANNGGNHQQIDEKWKITTTDFLGEKDAYLTVLEIKTVDEFDLTEYSVQVDNTVSIGTSSVQVIAATKPNAPSQLRNVSLDWKSVGLEWLGGNDGGINQQFVIEARSPKDNSVKAKKSVANTTSIVFDGIVKCFLLFVFYYNLT